MVLFTNRPGVWDIALHSLAAQTSDSYELIVVDDAKADRRAAAIGMARQLGVRLQVCPKKMPKHKPPFHIFRDPKNPQKSTRAEFLGVSDGVLKTDPRPGVQKVRFCHYLLYLS